MRRKRDVSAPFLAERYRIRAEFGENSSAHGFSCCPQHFRAQRTVKQMPRPLIETFTSASVSTSAEQTSREVKEHKLNFWFLEAYLINRFLVEGLKQAKEDVKSSYLICPTVPSCL